MSGAPNARRTYNHTSLASREHSRRRTLAEVENPNNNTDQQIEALIGTIPPYYYFVCARLAHYDMTIDFGCFDCG